MDNKAKQSIFIVGAVILELLMFLAYANRVTKNTYPTAFDQICYMLNSYTIYENIISKNFGEIVNFIVSNPTGCLMQILGAVLLFIFGNSRVTLLLINVFGHLLVQLLGGYCIWKICKNEKYSLIFEGLYLMTNSAFFWAGDLLDFRIDFFASCLYTCWILLYICYNKLEKRSFFIGSIVFASVLVWTRTITIAYILGVIGCSFVLNCIVNRKIMKKNIKKTVAYIMVIIIAVFPYIFLLRNTLYNYYGIGHLLGVEKNIRAMEYGLSNIWQHILYYPTSLVRDHLGNVAFVTCIVIILVGCIGYITNMEREKKEILLLDCEGIIISFSAILVPICILTLDQSKSPVVVNIVTASVVVFVVYLFYILVRNNDKKIFLYITNIVTILSLTCGVIYYLSNITGEKINYSNAKRTQNIKCEMNLKIAEYVEDFNIEIPVIFCDRMREWMSSGSVSLFIYEEYGDLVEITDILGKYGNAEGMLLVQEYDKEIITKALEKSDIVVTSPNDYKSRSFYPYDISLERERSYIYDYCVSNLKHLITEEVEGDYVSVYVREKVNVVSISDDWLLKNGTKVNYNKMDMESSTILLEGDLSEYTPLNVNSYCRIKGEEVPSSVKIDSKNNKYQIFIDVSGVQEGKVEIQLDFSEAFVPAELGINEDITEYVLPFPADLKILENNAE